MTQDTERIARMISLLLWNSRWGSAATQLNHPATTGGQYAIGLREWKPREFRESRTGFANLNLSAEKNSPYIAENTNRSHLKQIFLSHIFLFHQHSVYRKMWDRKMAALKLCCHRHLDLAALAEKPFTPATSLRAVNHHMRLSRLTAYHVRIPLKHKVRHASHSREETDSLVVRCELDNGAIGWGEGLPRPYVTGETIDNVWSLLAESDLARQLAQPFDSLTQAIKLADQIKLAVADGGCPFVERGCFGNSARCAIELSLLDAVARSEGVPLSRITELLPEAIAIRESLSQVCYSAAITAMSPWSTLVRAWKIRLYGFHQCKVKVGVEGVDDADQLRRIRKVLSVDRIALRIDANEAWTCENLESKLAPLLPYGMASLEQPVPHQVVAGLAKLRGRIGVPLMLDESLCSLTDAHRAIESGTCDLFNIRLSKCGGFVPSLRLAALAHQAGLGYQLGCQVGETGILSAAGRHFACSVANIRFLEGSYDRHLVRERLTVQDLTFGRCGVAPALAAPGLGIEIDEAALRRVTVREQTCATNWI